MKMKTKYKLTMIGIAASTMLSFLAVVASVVLAGYGFYLYWIGFHNFDSAQNMERIITYLGGNSTEWFDTYNIRVDNETGNETKTIYALRFTENYVMGVEQTREAFYWAAGGSFLFGIGLISLIHSSYTYGKYERAKT